MKGSEVSDKLQRELREFVAERTGLHFPQQRWADLQRGVSAAIKEMGFSDFIAGAKWLLAAPLTKAQLDVLISYLTVGETYFFREQKTFAVLAQKILPEIIRSKRCGSRRLRIWSAACCTGEEAYSLAILVQQLIPDLSDWVVTIQATDINSQFLKTAATGIYSEWSFRNTPAGFKDRYFRRTEDGRYAILPKIKERVTFAQLNLVTDPFPSLLTEINALDLILCRNVLMYFSPDQARRVIENLRRALLPDGWLVVSPSEASQTLFSKFRTVNYPGVILYQNHQAAGMKRSSPTPWGRHQTEVHGPETLAVAEAQLSPRSAIHKPSGGLFKDSNSAPQNCEAPQTEERLIALADTQAASDVQTFSTLTRSLANEGKLTEALASCDRWIEAARLDHCAYYLRGIVLQELGEAEQARRSFQTAAYLDPRFVLAHFALANLARTTGRAAQASKHFAYALSVLDDYQSEDTLPESDGLSAGRLREMIVAIMTMEVRP